MCDTLAIVRSGGVLFAKNSDRDPNEAQLLDWQPRRTHARGARVQCTWIEIPQVAETNAVLLSRPFWMWGAEMGTNEHGVTIGNEAVFTRVPYAKSGLTGMDLLRLALERAATAADAVRTVVDLLEEFGQGGGCSLEYPHRTYHNSFIVADTRTAFVLETAGRHHAIEEVRGARSISNGLTIPGFAEQHSDFLKTRICGCRSRRPRTQALAEHAAGPRDLARILRDHGADDAPPRYSRINGGLGAPCVHAGGMLASSQTTGSWISELRPGSLRHWATGTAAPCTGLFKPVAVDQPQHVGTPTERADEDSLWWRHERLHRAVVRDPLRLGPRYFGLRDELEAAWFVDPPDSSAAFAEAARALASWTDDIAGQSVADRRPRFVKRYWARRNAWAGLDLSARRGAVAAGV
ncbi:MAG: peptidase U34 [Planctomycetota bacterium]|nr:MAG: peptidase U34 [Planctomycetota bacterium]